MLNQSHNVKRRDRWHDVGTTIMYLAELSLFVVAAIHAARFPGPQLPTEKAPVISAHEASLADIASYTRLKSAIDAERNADLTTLLGMRQNIRPSQGLIAHTSLAVDKAVPETAKARIRVWSARAQRKAKKRRKYFSRAKRYRTVCVRLCDGYYFPISADARSRDFLRDEAVCANSCGAPARLFVIADEAGEPADMQDVYGRRYADLRTAFRYRRVYDNTCSCNAHPWQQEARNRHKSYALAAKASAGDFKAGRELAKLTSRLNGEETAREIAKASLVSGVRPLPNVMLAAHTGSDIETGTKTYRRLRAAKRGYGTISPRVSFAQQHTSSGKRGRRNVAYKGTRRTVKKAKWTPPMALGAKQKRRKSRYAKASRYYRPVLETFQAPFGDDF